TVVLPAGTTAIPTVIATAAGTAASINITQASAVPGTATVVVTAQNGDQRTYTVNFTQSTPVSGGGGGASSGSTTVGNTNTAGTGSDQGTQSVGGNSNTNTGTGNENTNSSGTGNNVNNNGQNTDSPTGETGSDTIFKD